MHKTLMKLSDEQFVDEINKAFVREITFQKLLFMLFDLGIRCS